MRAGRRERPARRLQKTAKKIILNANKPSWNKGEIHMQSSCEYCVNFYWDEECGGYVCGVNLDEDELMHFLQSSTRHCPWFQMGDEYKIVQKQN